MSPTFWERHGITVLTGGFILLALAGAVLWRILKPGPQPVLPPEIVAREALIKCRVRPESGSVLSEVSRVLCRYIGAVLEFPPGELTTSEFCGRLERSEKIAPQLTRDISDFLRACDERKFSPALSSNLGGAGAPPCQKINAADRALEFLALTEKEIHLQDANKNERRV
jgi:hypothetical protein